MRDSDLTTRRRVLDLLRRHGWNATSFQILEPDFVYWFDDDEAVVAYVDTGHAWVVAGGPVAAFARLPEIVAGFINAARARRRRVVFFAVEQRFVDAVDLPAIHVGEQPSWSPAAWDARHRGHRTMKEQLRRARAKGVRVARVTPDDAMRGEIAALVERWQESKPMPPMAFLVELHPFVFPEERRYYVARAGERLAGVLVAVPVYDRGGWFFEDLLRDPAAPNGTIETLVDAAMRDVAADGCTFVTLGLAPLAGDARWLQLARRSLRGFYNFAGLRAFKAKFRPDAWDPIYLVYRDRGGALVALYDVLSAFARGRVVRFAIAAVFRAPAIVLRALAILLVPWIAILIASDTRRWFPSARVKHAWIAFDAVMAAMLFSLAARWRRPLALAACAATSADVVLTAAQALAHNLPRRRRGWRELAIIGASVVAPLLATAILAGGLRRRQT